MQPATRRGHRYSRTRNSRPRRTRAIAAHITTYRRRPAAREFLFTLTSITSGSWRLRGASMSKVCRMHQDPTDQMDRIAYEYS